MAEWSSKNFLIQGDVRKCFDEIPMKKGDQMLAASAAILWYVHASPEERMGYENSVRKIDAGILPVEAGPPVTGKIPAEWPELLNRIEQLEIAVENITETAIGLQSRIGVWGDRLDSEASPEDVAEEADRTISQTENVAKKQGSKRSKRRSKDG